MRIQANSQGGERAAGRPEDGAQRASPRPAGPPVARDEAEEARTSEPAAASGDVRFRPEARAPAAAAQAPDFARLIDRLQRRELEAGRVSAAPPPAFEARVDDGALLLAAEGAPPCAVRLLRVMGLAKTPPPRPGPGAAAPVSAKVLAGLCRHPASFLYLLCGDGADVRLYLGIKADGASASAAASAARAAFESLQTCLLAAYADIRLTPLRTEAEYGDVQAAVARLPCAASLVGTPSADQTGDALRSNADRLVEALAGAAFCYVVDAYPVGADALRAAVQATASRIADTHRCVKVTASGSMTSTRQESREQLDRFAQHYEGLLEVAAAQFDAGLREGMWNASVSLLAASAAQLERGGALLRALYGGRESKPEPVKIVGHANPAAAVGALKCFQFPDVAPQAAPEGLSGSPVHTALCSGDLGLLVELPRKEAPGFRVTRLREFALDIDSASGKRVELGPVLSRSGPTRSVFGLDVDDVTRHALVVGVTGSGKTNTAMHLLQQLWCAHRVPFLVIEPAKAQYRNLLAHGRFRDLQLFAPGYKNVAPFRLNPFEFPPGIDPQAHITNLYTVFNAAFILYAPMPYILERALYEVYEDRGWDLGVGRHPEEEAKTGRPPALAYPTLTDLYHKVRDVVDRLGYDTRIRMDVTAGLQARIDSLRVGAKGQTLDTRRSVPFDALLERPTVFEMSHMGSDDEKAFLIGLILMRLYEARELGGDSPVLKHVTLVEEAHRLLTRTNTDTSQAESANVKGKAVETFCNMLAEIRSYGEGIIIAEQIPAKLAPDVLKNTNLKVMHRLVAADDRELMGATMNVQGAQSLVVTSLARGEAVAFAEGVETPVLVKVPHFRGTAPVSDSEVRRCSQLFYRQQPELLRQTSGCAHCTDVCHYGALAKRVADRDEVQSHAWGFALSCLCDPACAPAAWTEFCGRLLDPARVGPVRAADRQPLAWCLALQGAERAFVKVRERGAGLRDLEALLELFGEMGEALRSESVDAAARVALFRSRLAGLLRLGRGPYDGCEACEAACVWALLADGLAASQALRDGLSKAFKEKEAVKAVRAYCESVARRALFTEQAESVRGLASCFYVQVARRVGAARVAQALRTLYRPVPNEAGEANKQREV